MRDILVCVYICMCVCVYQLLKTHSHKAYSWWIPVKLHEHKRRKNNQAQYIHSHRNAKTRADVQLFNSIMYLCVYVCFFMCFWLASCTRLPGGGACKSMRACFKKCSHAISSSNFIIFSSPSLLASRPPAGTCGEGGKRLQVLLERGGGAGARRARRASPAAAGAFPPWKRSPHGDRSREHER